MADTKAELKEVRLRVVGGAIIEAPVWEKHHRSSNWAAVIGVDAGMPGGMARRFIDRGRGVALYLAEQIAPLDAMEFAGDYFTFTREKRSNRWFGVVKLIESDGITLIECKTGLAAVLLSEKMRKERFAAQPGITPQKEPEQPAQEPARTEATEAPLPQQ